MNVVRLRVCKIEWKQDYRVPSKVKLEAVGAFETAVSIHVYTPLRRVSCIRNVLHLSSGVSLFRMLAWTPTTLTYLVVSFYFLQRPSAVSP